MDQLVLWTVGVKLTTPIETEKGLSVAQSLKKMINPAMVGILLAVTIVFTNVQLPELLNTALVKTGAVTTPMAMIYLGGLFCFTDIGTYIKKPEFYCSIVVKMCIFPVLFYYLLCLIPAGDRMDNVDFPGRLRRTRIGRGKTGGNKSADRNGRLASAGGGRAESWPCCR